jgi:hypothetical protein
LRRLLTVGKFSCRFTLVGRLVTRHRLAARSDGDTQKKKYDRCRERDSSTKHMRQGVGSTSATVMQFR